MNDLMLGFSLKNLQTTPIASPLRLTSPFWLATSPFFGVQPVFFMDSVSKPSLSFLLTHLHLYLGLYRLLTHSVFFALQTKSPDFFPM